LDQKNSNSSNNNDKNSKPEPEDFDEWLKWHAEESGEDLGELRASFSDGLDEAPAPEHLSGTLEQGEAFWLKRKISWLKQELKIERAGNELLLKRIDTLEEAFDFKFEKAPISMEKQLVAKAMGFNQLPRHIEKEERENWEKVKKRVKENPPTYYRQLRKDREEFDDTDIEEAKNRG